MKPLFYYLSTSVFLISMVLFVSSCDTFEEINTNPAGVADEQLVADGAIVAEPLRQMQLGIYTATPNYVLQLQENLNADLYSGYLSIPTPFLTDKNNNNYAMVDGWNASVYSTASNNVLLPASAVEKEVAKNPDELGLFGALAQVLKVMGVHRVTDKFGPVVYSKFGVAEDDNSFSYDSQEQLYNLFFTQLEEALLVLNVDTKKKLASDLVYNSNFNKWAQFANTLRLRLAMRISFVSPDKAKAEAEKSLASSAGLIKENGDNFIVDIGGIVHALNTITTDWNDTRMGASMETYGKGFNDPRLSRYFQPSFSGGEFKGIRTGTPISAKSVYQDTTSALVHFPGEIRLFVAAETYFLLAEAKLRGWNLSTHDAGVDVLYNKGIEKSFEQHGVSGGFAAYIDNTTDLAPMDFVDAVGEVNNNYTFSDSDRIPIKLDVASSKQTQFQQIITQKWLAMYPDGAEAWAEQRRTGYPILMPLEDDWKKTDAEDGAVPTGEYIRRLTIPENIKDNNPIGYGKINFPDGDKINARLWWDVPNKNIP